MKHSTMAAHGIRRKRRNREEIAALVREYRSSGLTSSAFARSKGVCLATVNRWLEMVDGGANQEAQGHRLVPVRLSEEMSDRLSLERSAFELTFPGGPRISIPADFQEADLRRLIAVLKETC